MLYWSAFCLSLLTWLADWLLAGFHCWGGLTERSVQGLVVMGMPQVLGSADLFLMLPDEPTETLAPCCQWLKSVVKFAESYLPLLAESEKTRYPLVPGLRRTTADTPIESVGSTQKSPPLLQ